jgi:hypothetical protein
MHTFNKKRVNALLHLALKLQKLRLVYQNQTLSEIFDVTKVLLTLLLLQMPPFSF